MEQAKVDSEMRASEVKFDIVDDKGALFWRNYRKYGKFFFLKAMFSAEISAITSRKRSISDSID